MFRNSEERIFQHQFNSQKELTGPTVLVLDHANVDTSGNYTCEVTRGPPTFGMDYKDAQMTFSDDTEYTMRNQTTDMGQASALTGTGHKTTANTSGFLIICTVVAMLQLYLNTRNM